LLKEAPATRFCLGWRGRHTTTVARRWTVDELGREVGLSRSALADHFIRLLGVPPMHYLANWRMQVASERLRGTSASLAQVAELVG
jgi:transcriptional regulator GlxA family with amidase domain